MEPGAVALCLHLPGMGVLLITRHPPLTMLLFISAVCTHTRVHAHTHTHMHAQYTQFASEEGAAHRHADTDDLLFFVLGKEAATAAGSPFTLCRKGPSSGLPPDFEISGELKGFHEGPMQAPSRP